MPLLYTVITRGTTVLAKYASCPGNFAEVTEQILAQITPDQPAKLTYSHENFLFHYTKDSGLIYLCITDNEFPREKAFAYLDDVKQRFSSSYGAQVQIALPYAMNSEFSKVLCKQMKYYSTPGSDKIARVEENIEELRDIMVKNIDAMLERGQRLDLLVTKTENLESTSVHFQRSSRNLRRAMFFKNMKLTLLIVLLSIIVVYIVVSLSCGGLAWPNCV